MITAQASSQCQDAVRGNIQKEGSRKWKYPEIQGTLQIRKIMIKLQ